MCICVTGNKKVTSELRPEKVHIYCVPAILGISD